MTVRVTDAPFDPWQELARHRPARPGGYGGTAVFVGTMRDHNAGAAVSAMTLEHYPAMTERALADIEREARVRHDLIDALVIHRHGALAPGEPIVLVAAWAAHRAAAFAACREMIDALKTRAPFWKHEETPAGPRWVEPGEG